MAFMSGEGTWARRSSEVAKESAGREGGRRELTPILAIVIEWRWTSVLYYVEDGEGGRGVEMGRKRGIRNEEDESEERARDG
jgi:hypothetical protein